MTSNAVRWILAIALAASIVPGCGGGGGGGGSAPPAPPDPSVTITTPAGTQTGNVTINYFLVDLQSDPSSISVEFSTNGGGSFAAATPAAGGDGTTGLTSSSLGTAHVYLWNSLLDGVATGALNAAVRVRITASNSVVGGTASTASFSVDNSANTPPAAAITTPGGSAGLVALSYTLSDAQSSVCGVDVRFSTNGGATYSPAAAFEGPGGDGTTALSSSPIGIAHVFVWNSYADGVALLGSVGTIRLRITPTDGVAGTPVPSANFAVDNSAQSSGGSVGAPYPANSNPGYDAEAITTDGRSLYICGHNFSQWRIEKVDPVAGTTAWQQSSDPSGGDDRAGGLVLSGPYLFVFGLQEVAPFGSPTERQWRVEKRLAVDGTLVAAFGTGGVLVSANLGDMPGVGVVVDSSSLYIACLVNLGAGDYSLRLEKRLLSDGSPVTAFGTAGLLTENVNALGDGAIAMALDATHLYLAGAQDLGPTSDAQLRFEKRLLTDGSLDVSFGTGGVVLSNASATVGAMELCTAITIDTTYMYVFANVETGAATGIFTWRVEKRDLATGTTTVSTVAGTGTAPFGPGGGCVALTGGSLYVTGRDGATPADGQWRFEKRSASTLALDTSFNATGIVTFNPTVSSDEEFTSALIVTGGVLFVIGSDNGATRRWRIEARWK